MRSERYSLKVARWLFGAVAMAILLSGCGNVPLSSSSQSGTASINNPIPAIASLSPTKATAGGAAFTLTVNGSDFVTSSSITWNGTTLAATYVSDSQITAQVPASSIANSGSVTVEVSNPAPGGGSSNAATFDITDNNPLPQLETLSPSAATVGGAAFTLTVSGSDFVTDSVINWNGAALATHYISETSLSAQVPASDIAATGTATVKVVSPTPGGGTSSGVTFTIRSMNPVPAIASLSPASATAGGAAFTLSISGSNFVSTSVVHWNGTALSTHYVSDKALTAQVLATNIVSAGNESVTVVSPAPGGGTSAADTFTVTSSNPLPSITSLSPASVTAGSAAFTLTVNGSSFVSASVVKWNGTSLPTTYASATKLTAQVAASLVATAGTPSVTVVSPAPGGGTSTAATFTIGSVNPMPAIASLSPASASAGGAAFALTVNGGNFTSASVVKWNGTALPTTFTSAAKLTAQVSATLIASTGTPSVTVVTPAPGGGTSSAVTFTINSASNSVPTVSSLSPASATAGDAAFTLTVNGSGFVSTSVVNWNGSALPTTYTSGAKLTAQVSAALVASAGTPSVTVFSPAPGGGTSSGSTFTIISADAVPAVSSLSPASATAGGAAFTLTVNGSNFIGTSVVNWNGTALTTTYVSASKVTAQVPAADISSAGTASVTVVNSGGASGATTFTISSVMVGCGTASPQTGTFNLTTTDGSESRQYLVQVPADYSSSKSYALTFVYHGLNGNSSVSQAFGLQNATGASEASIFVFPNSRGSGWDDSHAGIDMKYFDNMLAAVKATYCIDSNRVFAAGFSWGGDFVTALSLTRGNVLRAVAVNSATDEFRNYSDYTSHIDYAFQTTTHPAVRFGHAIGGDVFYGAPLFATTSTLFQHENSCSATSTSYPSSFSQQTCKTFDNCSNQVIECPFDASLGHILPPNWPADTWAFFASFH
jgi:poly(3-hydroxybutyrate) depolymerase